MKKYLLTALLFASAGCLWAQDQPPAGKFSGYVFGDYFYHVQRDSLIGTLKNTALSGARDFQGFQIRRIYFTYDNTISAAFSARFRMEATTGSPIVKDAYLKWKDVFRGSDACFGLQPTPAYEISEAAWGYRSLEKTIMDLRGIVPSRDLGASLRGSLAGSGTLGYWLMVGNNSGTGTESDKFKRYYANIQVRPSEELQATLYADYAAQPDVNDPSVTALPPQSVGHGTLTTAVFAGYAKKDRFTVGIEGFMTSTKHDYATAGSSSLRTRTSAGVSVFGSVNLASELVFVGRYDWYDPNTDDAASVVSNALERNYLLAGLAWRADKNVSIIPNIQVETYEKAARASVRADASVTARITLSYVFL